MAYELALSFPHRLAGLIGMSTYFATADTISLSAESAGLHIAVFHGTADPVVAEQLGRKAVGALREKGYAPTYQTYPMEHSVCLEEIREIGTLLKTWLLN